MSKEEREKNIQAQPALTESIDQAEQMYGFKQGDWPDEKWWRVFNSDELNELVETALIKNPSISEAKARVERAANEAIIESSTLYPIIYFNAEEQLKCLSKNGYWYNLNPTLGRDAHVTNLFFNFNYEIDFWAKYKNIARSSITKAMSEKAMAKQVELVVSTSIARTYFALKASFERRNLYADLALVRKKYFALQSLLTRRALNSKIPMTKAQERFLEATQFVADAEKEIQVTKHLLNILRGEGADSEIVIENEEFDFSTEVEIPETINIELVARRPDLMAAILRADALAYLVGAARADFYPNVDLMATLGLSSLRTGNLFDILQSGQASGKPALSLPVYTAGAIKAGVGTKKAMFNEAVFAYNDTLLKSTQDVADAISLLMAAFKTKKDQMGIVEQVALRHKIIANNYHHGLANLLEVYKVEEELILQKINNIQLTYAEYAGAIKLIRSLGGGYHYAKRSES